ncbi:MAG: signal peptidase II, partial [Ktedonobacterales bacterium]|nr:signal peptidase II [Ktedonobacterales bacterium]
MAISRRSAIKAPEPARTLTPEGQVRWDLIVAGVAVVVIIIDQITKALIHARFAGNHVYDVVSVVGNVVTLVFDKNPGAAFSSFTDSPLLLGLLIVIAVGVIAYMYWSNRARDYPLLKITFGFILGGAVGNLIDRVRLGYVTDFVHFQLPAIHFDFAIFNIADSAISIGVVLLAFVFWTLPREEPVAPGEDVPSDGDAAALPVAKASSA